MQFLEYGKGELGRGMIDDYVKLGIRVLLYLKKSNKHIISLYSVSIIALEFSTLVTWQKIMRSRKGSLLRTMSYAWVNYKMKALKVILHFLPWQSAKSLACF